MNGVALRRDDVLVCESATIAGAVTLGPQVSIWFGASVNAGQREISIGAGANIQDRAIVAAALRDVEIGVDVTLGHCAFVQDAVIEEGCLIGIRSVVHGGVVLPMRTLVTVGSVVGPGFRHIRPGYLVAGNPARALRPLTVTELREMHETAIHYRRIVQLRTLESVNTVDTN